MNHSDTKLLRINQLREGFTKKVAVILDFVQMTPLQGEQGDENVYVLCKVIIFSHGFQAGP